MAQSKNPWLSLECMSTVMMWLNPAWVNICAINLREMLPRRLILAMQKKAKHKYKTKAMRMLDTYGIKLTLTAVGQIGQHSDDTFA